MIDPPCLILQVSPAMSSMTPKIRALMLVLVAATVTASADDPPLEDRAIERLQQFIRIDSYGFDPVVIPESEWDRIHGNDERISVENFRRGMRDLFAIASEVVYD